MGGNWPSRERDTWPLGVETWKFFAVLAGAGLAVVVAGLGTVVAGLAVDELLLEQPAAATRPANRKQTASRDFISSPLWGRWYRVAADPRFRSSRVQAFFQLCPPDPTVDHEFFAVLTGLFEVSRDAVTGS